MKRSLVVFGALIVRGRSPLSILMSTTRIRAQSPGTVGAVPARVAPPWIETKSDHYSIFYQAGYDKDAEFTRTWLNRAEELLTSKYGVPFLGFYVSFYLYSAPTQYADVGLANLRCCESGANGLKAGTISYLVRQRRHGKRRQV